MSEKRILILEAYYGGSHKHLIDYLHHVIEDGGDAAVDMVTMSDKKWHWRMRTSALHLAENIPPGQQYSCLFVTCVLNLAELLGLRPELNSAHKILYFHENQLVYPVREHKERDFQNGYNQVLSCLVADTILFNSSFNMTSFLQNIKSYFNVMPDYRPKGLCERIRPKCSVLYYPLKLQISAITVKEEDAPLHIVWPHRWEHDKNPDDFFNTLFQLVEEEVPFHLSVLGQSYADNPDIFAVAKEKLKHHILNWGYLSSKEEYKNVLIDADVAISTANHEFFGVSMLEAVGHGCYPLCPNRLVYPEIFPKTYLYNTNQQLLKKLRNFCTRPHVPRKHKVEVDLSKFDGEQLKSEYCKHLLK